MRRHKTVRMIGVAVGCISLGLLSGGTDKVARAQSGSGPSFPVIIRLNREALRDALMREIHFATRINRTILGTHSTGESLTTGDVVVDFDSIDGDDHPVFVVRFQGTTHTKSIGTNGPAIIDSRTKTDFICSSKVKFDRDTGFAASPSEVQSNSKLFYDGFRANRGRLGNRLIARAASRRAGEARPIATQIVAKIQEDELTRHFDARLQSILDSWNTRLALARFIGPLIGQRSRLQMAAAPVKNGLKVGFGPEGRAAPLPELPGPEASDPPIEVWIHTSLMGQRTHRLLSFAEMAANSLKREGWISFATAEIWTSISTVDVEQLSPWTSGWLRFRFGTPADNVAATSTHNSRLAVDQSPSHGPSSYEAGY